MPKVVQPYYSIQYDGTNGSYIAGTWCTGITFVSDTGTVFTYNGDGGNHAVNLGEWLVVPASNVNDPGVFSEVAYEDRYVEIPPALALATGYALTPSITGSGGTANVAVDLDSTMSGTSYEASAVLAGTSALLTDLDITAVTVTDNNTVTVTVQNSGLVALAGATVIVSAGELA